MGAHGCISLGGAGLRRANEVGNSGQDFHLLFMVVGVARFSVYFRSPPNALGGFADLEAYP